MNMMVVFDNNTINFVFDVLNLSVDKDGFIIKKDTMQHVIDHENNKIHKNDVCFISKDMISKGDINSLLNVAYKIK